MAKDDTEELGPEEAVFGDGDVPRGLRRALGTFDRDVNGELWRATLKVGDDRARAILDERAERAHRFANLHAALLTRVNPQHFADGGRKRHVAGPHHGVAERAKFGAHHVGHRSEAHERNVAGCERDTDGSAVHEGQAAIRIT